MAVMFEGFSIREYTAKMRSVNVAKCWPFSGHDNTDDEITKERVEVLLPPITVPRFRWWSHELNNKEDDAEKEFQGTEEDERSRPVCMGFASATVSAHFDSSSREESRQGRVVSSSKARSRTPKKRSIVEIFAVAPQIESVVEDDDDDDVDGSEGEEDETLNLIKIDKKKKKKVEMLEKLMMKKNKYKKKIKTKKIKKKEKKLKKSIANMLSCVPQVINSKFELQSPVTVTRNLNGSLSNKEFPKDILGAVSIGRKKSGLKRLSTQKKQKVNQKSKLVAKQQEPVIPVRSILKNNGKKISGQSALNHRMHGGIEVNPCGILNPDRHVRFSEEDRIRGSRTIPTFEQKLCNFYPYAFASSSEKDQSMEPGEDLVTVEVSDDDVSIIRDNGSAVQPANSNKHLPGAHDLVDIPTLLRPPLSCQEKVKHSSDKSVSLGQLATFDDNMHMPGQGKRIESHHSPYVGIPKPFSALQVSDPLLNSPVLSNVSRASSSSAKFNDYFEDHTQEVALMTNTREFPPLPSSDLSGYTNANGRVPFTLHSAPENNNSHAVQHQPYQYPVEVMGSLYPPPEWKQRAVSFRDKCEDEGFYGLPLNSQGELIQERPSGKGRFNQPEKSGFVTSSFSILPVLKFAPPRSVKEKLFVDRVLPKDQLDLFPVGKENPNVHLPARLGVTESLCTQKTDLHWQISERRGNHYVCPLDSDMNLTNIPLTGCRQYDQVQNQKGNGFIHPKEHSNHMFLNASQPTMRLMGKDVAVGRSSNEMQGFEDGQIWTDKEIIAEHHPSAAALHNYSERGHYQQDWLLDPAAPKSKEIQAQPLETQSYQASRNNILMKAPESRLPHTYPDWQADGTIQNGSFNVNRIPSPKFHHFTHPSTSPVMFNSNANFQEPYTSGAETPRISSQLHLPSHAELKYRQDLPYTPKSAFNFPFLHPDCSEHIQPSWFPSSSKSLIPWLLQSTTQQVKPPITVSQPYSHVVGNYHLHTVGTNFFTTPSSHHSPLVSYTPDHITSHPQMSSLGPSFEGHPPPVPSLPGVKLTPRIDKGYRNRIFKVNDKMKSKAFDFNDLGSFQKTKKRPAAMAGYSRKPNKMRNLGKQEDFSIVTRLTRDNVSRDMQCHTGALEPNLRRDEAIGIEFFTNEAQRGGSPGNDYSKVDGVGRVGPIKLSAGAKHILKPSQNMDQDNSIPIHSTIPFAVVTNSGGIFESQKKSTKIYKF
ncbi:hypothetical protein CFOL_v3_08669 [Cephalotus follicularis]|uniref:Uncharacterized protein n=1 Tax=Cephalotus follicularis TaxID=3775 RepID=A0A1Q3BBD5_CEPFO|nr:hypothetical protein CFOL_v3_08669 [Cephalotus follicularis]